jgi:SAM-dependent methyltransferase
METELFDADYFERGLASGKSLYENYRWMPFETIKMAIRMIDYLGIVPTHSILDFGCALGFLVKAFRILGFEGWGCDISHYAIESSDGVRPYLKLCDQSFPFRQRFDFAIAKDVFEHINEPQLHHILVTLRKHANEIFAIIPLGENGKFIVPAYHLDKTHRIAENAWWWKTEFSKAEWQIEKFRYRVEGIKDNWADYEKGNGFFTLR